MKQDNERRGSGADDKSASDTHAAHILFAMLEDVEKDSNSNNNNKKKSNANSNSAERQNSLNHQHSSAVGGASSETSVSSMSAASSSGHSSSQNHYHDYHQMEDDDEAETSKIKLKKSKKRKRPRRPSLLQLSASLQQDAHWKSPSPKTPTGGVDNLRQSQPHHYIVCSHQHAYEWPNFAHLFQLTAALILCTLLAAAAAGDAAWQCVQLDAYNDYFDAQLVDSDSNDGNFQKQQSSEDDPPASKNCVHMLQRIVLPCSALTTACSLTIMWIIWRYNRHQISTITSSPPWSSVYKIMVLLLILFLIVLAAQTYSITEVMLQPAHTYSSSTTTQQKQQNSGDEEEEQSPSTFTNPYQALAAVDRLGRVGDNANLYYLAWLSAALAVALSYQVCTATLRARRAALREKTTTTTQQHPALEQSQNQQRQNTDMTAKQQLHSAQPRQQQKLIPTGTSWDLQDTANTVLYDQSRAAWYNSLYKLRVRTGIWTAAVVSCLIIVASAQGIWRQVLWPGIVQAMAGSNQNNSEEQQHNDGNKNDEIVRFTYFSVCQAASRQSSGDFTPQLCRRTVVAWFVGLVAAVLCATAIVLHLAAKYKHDSKKTLTATTADDEDNDGGDEDSMPSPQYYLDHDVMQLLTGGPPDFCSGPTNTSTSTTSFWQTRSSPAALFSRYYSHHHPKRLRLRTELFLAIMLSLLLGINAVIATGSQGPAATVGNLYYASWLSFLLCIRICLGCVEEFYNIENEDEEEEEEEAVAMNESSTSSSSVEQQQSKSTSAAAAGSASDPHSSETARKDAAVVCYIAPEYNDENKETIPQITHSHSAAAASEGSTDLAAGSNSVASRNTNHAKQEKKRLAHVRGYFFLAVFSTVCGAAAFDAGLNQERESLSREQLYITVAPCIVALLSYLLFFLCLSKRCYGTVSRFGMGGILSIISFYLLFGEMLLTMHSESSWAVNGVGEILMANLYYFSWASTLTSGVIMTLYVKSAAGIKTLDLTSALWAAIVKVCFVILGASLHIWHTISDNCEFDEISLGAFTFCSRTVLALVVSLTGILVGGLIVVGRLIASLCPFCKTSRAMAHIELLISLFLVFLFIAAVALITGIGGPGQSVGDMFYGTWLAFWVSLGISIQCYNQLNAEDMSIGFEEKQTSTPSASTESHQIPRAVDTVLV